MSDQPRYATTRVLLTGGTGFIGGHLLKGLLDDGHTVCALVRPNTDKSVIDPRAIVKEFGGNTDELIRIVSEFAPAIAVHAATNFVAKHTTEDVKPLIDANILFGLQLLQALATAGVFELINFGTSWQHDSSGAQRPGNLYAATKQAFETLVGAYAKSGLKAITLKLSDTYGPGDRRPKIMALLLRHAHSGEPLQLSPGEQKLSFVHAFDVVGAVRVAMQQVANGNARSDSYAVRGSEVLSLRELVSLFEDVSGMKIDARWGARPYRDGEVMIPWLGETLPGWTPKIDLSTGIAALIK